VPGASEAVTIATRYKSTYSTEVSKLARGACKWHALSTDQINNIVDEFLIDSLVTHQSRDAVLWPVDLWR